MPPRKRARTARAGSPDTATGASQQDDTAMDLDTSQPADTPLNEAEKEDEKPKTNVKSPWTDEQTGLLFKAIIRYKPAGMHKHFRMLAISDFLSAHGVDPDTYPHTRIPGIWRQLATFYNLGVIDEREELNVQLLEDENPYKTYKAFDLPWEEYGDMCMKRAWADLDDEDTSPEPEGAEPELPTTIVTTKRGRGGGRASESQPKTRSSTVDETDGEGSIAIKSSPARRGGRSTRNAKQPTPAEEEESEEEEAEEEAEEAGDEEEEDDDDEDELAKATPITQKAVRGVGSRGRGRGRGRGRVRARGRGG